MGRRSAGDRRRLLVLGLTAGGGELRQDGPVRGASLRISPGSEGSELGPDRAINRDSALWLRWTCSPVILVSTPDPGFCGRRPPTPASIQEKQSKHLVSVCSQICRWESREIGLPQFWHRARTARGMSCCHGWAAQASAASRVAGRAVPALGCAVSRLAMWELKGTVCRPAVRAAAPEPTGRRGREHVKRR
jgi:hypothetical protein